MSTPLEDSHVVVIGSAIGPLRKSMTAQPRLTAPAATVSPEAIACLFRKQTRPSTNATKGAAGTSRAESVSSALPLQLVEVIGTDPATVAEDLNHDGERDGDLGGRQPHDEEDDDLACGGVGGDEAVERHEVQARGVEHELDADQYGDEVASRHDRVDAKGEEDRREEGQISSVMRPPPRPSWVAARWR